MSGVLKIVLIVLGIVLIVTIVFALYFMVFQGGAAEPIPTLAPTAEAVTLSSRPPVTSEPGAGEDEAGVAGVDEVDVWARINENGVMLVGVSADYPPFEFYTDEFKLAGFDIALIQEVAQIMGLAVEFSDISFGGLFDALLVHQVDLAISAISYTAERESLVDFSNIYFVSQDAVLVTVDSNVGQLNDVEDLAAYRIGVQGSTVFEKWLRTELVDTGFMPETNLFIYQNMDLAARHLASGLTDMVVMDLPPAEVAVSTGDFRIAGQGLNQQLFALALPPGSGELQAAVNDALQQLWNSGRITELAAEYLNLTSEDIIPAPTPDPARPTATPDSPAGCIDAMEYVADLTHDDQNMTDPPALLPGESLRKGWRVRNTGDCAWNSLHSLVPVGGNHPAAVMGGEPVEVQGLVQPGQEYDFWADLVAPLAAGVYQEFWSVYDSRTDKLFGSRVWVGIQVAALPTVTPMPTQTPSADVRFTAEPGMIDQGQCSTLAWQTQNVRAVHVYPRGESWQDHGVSGAGTRQVCPNTTATYEMRVVKLDDTVEIAQVTVAVNLAPHAPTIRRFTVEPAQIALGQCANAQWQVTGQVSNVSIFRDERVILGNAPLSGSIQDCPAAQGEFRYSLEANGPGGSSRLQQFVRVIVDATPAPTPGGEPIVKLFSATPDQLKAGECTQVTWSAGGGTTKVDIVKDNQVVLANAPFAGSQQDCLNAAGTFVYGIRASNNAGQVATNEVTVSVSEDS